MRDFRKLRVWALSHQLALAVYDDTRAFPREERFGLTSQLRRSAISIPSNIAEGAGRRTPNDYAHFLDIALGSANELEYQLLLSKELGLIPETTHDEREATLREVRRKCRRLQEAVLTSFSAADRSEPETGGR